MAERTQKISRTETLNHPDFNVPFSPEVQEALRQRVSELQATIEEADSFETEEELIFPIDPERPIYPADKEAYEEGYRHRMTVVRPVTDPRVAEAEAKPFPDATPIEEIVRYYFAPDGRVAIQRSFMQNYNFSRSEYNFFTHNYHMMPTRQKRLDFPLTPLERFTTHPDTSVSRRQKVTISRSAEGSTQASRGN